MEDTLMEELPDYGDHMTLEEWFDAVKCRMFIDYDGCGDLATIDKVSKIGISPSQSKDFDFPEWCTHIVWYNR
jgi:hypothetical protein